MSLSLLTSIAQQAEMIYLLANSDIYCQLIANAVTSLKENKAANILEHWGSSATTVSPAQHK